MEPAVNPPGTCLVLRLHECADGQRDRAADPQRGRRVHPGLCRVACRLLDRCRGGAPSTGADLRPLRATAADPLRQRSRVHRHQPAGLAAGTGDRAGPGPEGQPTAKRLRGAVQRLDARRAPQPRGLPLPDRGPRSIANWVWHYNHERPHSGLQMRTPAAFAAYIADQPPASPVVASERGE